MRYAQIRNMDISNGEKIGIALFTSGCRFYCKNCFNKDTHDFNLGYEFNDDVIEKILNLCTLEHIEGLSILGGEPLHPKNILGTTKLCKKFKEKFPNKSIWIWSGFLFDELKDKDIFNYVDVLVDGRFKDELKNIKLKYCGSSNQRVIDIKKSKKENRCILWQEDLK